MKWKIYQKYFDVGFGWIEPGEYQSNQITLSDAIHKTTIALSTIPVKVVGVSKERVYQKSDLASIEYKTELEYKVDPIYINLITIEELEKHITLKPETKERFVKQRSLKLFDNFIDLDGRVSIFPLSWEHVIYTMDFRKTLNYA